MVLEKPKRLMMLNIANWAETILSPWPCTTTAKGFFDLQTRWLHGVAAQRMHGRGELVNGVRKERMHEGMTAPSGERCVAVVHVSLHRIAHAVPYVDEEFSAMSGFSLGSLAERLYLGLNEEGDAVAAAAILLYVLALIGRDAWRIEQAASVERVTNLIDLSLEKLLACSNDAVCMDHVPGVVRKTVQRAMLACCFQKHLRFQTWT